MTRDFRVHPCLALQLLLLACCATPLLTLATSVRLTPGASTIESAFPESTTSTSADAASTSPRALASLSPLQGTVITVAGQLMASAAAAYKAENKDFSMTFRNSATNAGVKANFLADNSGFDYAVSTASPTGADYQSLPSLGYYPLQSNGIVPTFNLPSSVRNGGVLALTGLTMCRIMRGNITSWTDPAIQATNPSFNFVPATGQSIKVLLLSTAAATHLAFSTYCNKVDPAYKLLGINPSSSPAYPTALYAAVKWYTDIDLMDSGVSDESWCFTITTLSNARTIGLPIANFVNSQGSVITATTNSMSLNLFELATNGFAAGSNSFDLTNPQTAQAWPMLTMSYLYVDKSQTATTCSSKRELLAFFLWFYTSSVVAAIGETLSIVLFSSVFISQLQIIERLRSELTCLDAQLISSNQQVGYLSIHSLATQSMQLYANFYLTVDSTRTYSISTISESLAIQRIVAGELDAAIVNPAVLTADDQAMLDIGAAVLIPAFVVGVVPIFNLPPQIATWAAANKDAAAALPALLPLKLDLETLTALFLGQISSWLDPALTALNPQLTAWFTNAAAPANLTLVVGATAAGETCAAAKLLFQAMAQSSTAQKAENQQFFPAGGFATIESNPFTAVVKADAARAAADGSALRVTMIDTEARLTLKSAVIPGSVSYRTVANFATPSVEFTIVQKNDAGQIETVLPQVSSLVACSAPHVMLPAAGLDKAGTAAKYASTSTLSTQQAWINPVTPAAGCWPLSTLLSFAASLEYASTNAGAVTGSSTSNSCTSGLHALEFINYVQSTSILTAPAASFGVARLADSSFIEALSQDSLYAATCDGTSMLVIDPYYYTVASAVAAFGTAFGIIGLLMTVVSIGIVYHFRFRVVIRSASAPFLCLILTGLALLFGALIAWSREPTGSSCLAFQWSFCLGFQSLFVPLFLKTWRVWRIFSGAHLRVVKLSNFKLMAITGAILLAECTLLAIWSGVSPLQPIEYSRELSTTHYFTHCSVGSTGMPFVIIEAVFKAALLIFGAIMAFSTRNVKGSYNEASQIGMTIYQTVLASIILIGIIVFISAVEAVLTILVAIYLIWIGFASFGILFGPKFFLLFKSEVEMLEASRSELPQEKSQGFSFASVAVMSNAQMKQYYYALRLQIHKTEGLLGLPKTAFAEFKGFVPSAERKSQQQAQPKKSVSDRDETSIIDDRPASSLGGSSGGTNASSGDYRIMMHQSTRATTPDQDQMQMQINKQMSLAAANGSLTSAAAVHIRSSPAASTVGPAPASGRGFDSRTSRRAQSNELQIGVSVRSGSPNAAASAYAYPSSGVPRGQSPTPSPQVRERDRVSSSGLHQIGSQTPPPRLSPSASMSSGPNQAGAGISPMQQQEADSNSASASASVLNPVPMPLSLDLPLSPTNPEVVMIPLLQQRESLSITAPDPDVPSSPSSGMGRSTSEPQTIVTVLHRASSTAAKPSSRVPQEATKS